MWDASPDSYGQHVIDLRLAGGTYGDAADVAPAGKLTYLLESGSDRIGALDFQRSATEFVPRSEAATLDELHAVAQSLERGGLSATLTDAFVHGTSVGGARPKVLVRDGDTAWIAKLSASTDPYPVVKAEAVAMALAGRVGIEFERIVFNIAIGNNDDHPRNHAAFWDGEHLELTPAYDLCPQLRSGTESRQAMDISSDGKRDSRFAVCVDAAASYGLSRQQAREVIDQQVSTIRDSWQFVADEAGLTEDERNLVWRRQFLNHYAFDGYT